VTQGEAAIWEPQDEATIGEIILECIYIGNIFQNLLKNFQVYKKVSCNSTDSYLIKIMDSQGVGWGAKRGQIFVCQH
jgi:hypothetical protein